MRGQIPGSPHIEGPEEIEVRNGEACWINHIRVCGADCIAYNIDEVDEAGSPVQGPTKCMIIVLGGQVASELGALVQLKQRALKQAQTSASPAAPTMTFRTVTKETP